jgi:hypothetical protein
MSEVKKLIISRKKIDKKGNEYALIKISSNQQKRPEIRVIKFKKSPKKSKQKKLKSDENSSTTKSEKISNKDLLKQNLKSNIIDSPTARDSKFKSFISTFNTPSKIKNSFIYNSPKPYIPKNKNYNLRYINTPYLNNYLYSPNFSNNNSEIFKTEYSINIGRHKKENLKKNNNVLNNTKKVILPQKNKQNSNKMNNLKLKQSKINNIKIKKIKDKKEVINIKTKTNYETEFKKKLLSEIKEINKYRKKVIKGINNKDKNTKINNNIKKINSKVKKVIKTKNSDYLKNRANYLKIRKEEERIRNRRLLYDLTGKKNIDNHFSFTKLLIDDDKKEIEDLKKKYEKLKIINSEYNSYIREIQNMNFKRIFTPLDFMKYSKNHLSYSKIESNPKKILSSENSPRKITNIDDYKNNSLILLK